MIPGLQLEGEEVTSLVKLLMLFQAEEVVLYLV